MPYLIHNPGTPDEICELKSGSNTIGREQDNNIVVRDDNKGLSRHHAELAITDDVIIRDLHSRNGTFVNDIKIAQCELKDGDLIRCANVVFKFVHALESSMQESPNGQHSNLSIVRRFSPEKTRVDMQDLLHQDSLEYQGSVLMLRQQDTEQRTLDKLKILLEVSKQLSSPNEFDKLLEKILELLFKIMNVDRSVILMVNQETGQLEQKAVRGRAGISADY